MKLVLNSVKDLDVDIENHCAFFKKIQPTYCILAVL